MKTSFKTTILTVLLITVGIISFAQEENNTTSVIPRWVCSKGYWMVKSNIHTPMQAWVYFYNNDNVLLHSEKLVGVHLDPNNTRTKMKLKRALENIISQQEAGMPINNNVQIMAVGLKH